MSATNEAGPGDVRADVWLWAARFFKTRALAKEAIDGGKVEHNGAGCKPSKSIRVGDRMRVTRGEDRLEIEVLALSEKRGPAAMAQSLYRESEASIATRDAQREQRRMQGGGLIRPSSRPDKKSRRLIRQFKDTH
jgi:ribosome-associated heat shock protein Hsp15